MMDGEAVPDSRAAGDEGPDDTGSFARDTEAELFRNLAASKLRSRTLWAGLVLLASLLLPYEVVENVPQFTWQLLGELPPAGVVAAFVPAAAGVVLLLSRLLMRSASTLAVSVLSTLCATWLCQRLGAEASAWGILPLPTSFATRGGFVLLALALVAGATQLGSRPASMRLANAMRIAAIVAVAAFYFLPGRSEAPIVEVVRNLSLLGDMPTLQLKLGILTVAFVALFPALIVGAGLLQIARPPQQSMSLLSMTATVGLPVLLGLLLLTWQIGGNRGAALVGAAGAAIGIAVIIGLLAAALETLGEALSWQSGESVKQLRRLVAIAVGIVVVVTATQAWLALPPEKGVDWPLSKPTEEGDQLFGELIPAWSRARWRWDGTAREGSSAEDLVGLREDQKKMLDQARAVDGDLTAALDELGASALDLDVPSRRWYRLVARVNEASRRGKLPYYLDPRLSISKEKEGLRRYFAVNSYRIVKTATYDVDGAPYTALFLEGFGQHGTSHSVLLGFSRDVQPFALVIRDAVKNHSEELRTLASVGSCALEREIWSAAGNGVGDIAERQQLLGSCVGVVDALIEEHEDDLDEQLAMLVARHELQHQIDGPLLRLALPVMRKMAAYTEHARERTNRELSAFIAELTTGGASPKLSLITPLRHALLSNGGTYHHASLLLFETLHGKKLRDYRGELEIDKVAAAFDELTTMSDENLRTRAGQTWEQLYGDALPSVKQR